MGKKVTCTLPNASEEISGVEFERQEDGSVVAHCSDDDAAKFEGINGYTIEDAEGVAPAAKKAGRPKKDGGDTPAA